MTQTLAPKQARSHGKRGAQSGFNQKDCAHYGVLFIITFITAIPAALVLYVPVLTDPDYIVGAGAADADVRLGAFLELILIIANIGTAVALFPILKRQNERSLSAMSRLVSLNAPSLPSASLASFRS